MRTMCATMALPVPTHSLATILTGNTVGAGNAFPILPPPANPPTQRVSLLPSFMRRLSAGASDVLRRLNGASDMASLNVVAKVAPVAEVNEVAKMEVAESALETVTALAANAPHAFVLREACLFEGCCTLEEKCKRKVCLGGC